MKIRENNYIPQLGEKHSYEHLKNLNDVKYAIDNLLDETLYPNSEVGAYSSINLRKALELESILKHILGLVRLDDYSGTIQKDIMVQFLILEYIVDKWRMSLANHNLQLNHPGVYDVYTGLLIDDEDTEAIAKARIAFN